jgi:hypothetical protein
MGPPVMDVDRRISSGVAYPLCCMPPMPFKFGEKLVGGEFSRSSVGEYVESGRVGKTASAMIEGFGGEGSPGDLLNS